MKLSQIYKNASYFNRPNLHQSDYNKTGIKYTSGMPNKQRHRKYFGMNINKR